MAESIDRAAWRYVSHLIAAIGNSVGASCEAKDFDPYSEAHKVVMASADEWASACGAMVRLGNNR